MRKGLIGLGHPVHFVTLLHRAATTFRGLEQSPRQPRIHRLLAAFLRRLADPAHRQRRTPHRPHLHRHLVVRAAYTTALHFDHRLYVLNRLAEYLERVLAGFRLDNVKRVIDDVLGNRFLAARHDHVDKFLYLHIAVLRVRQDVALGYFSTTWH